VADFEPEDHKSYLREAFEETLGLHPSTWTIVQQTAETIVKLTSAGWVILVGRGANVVTANMAQTFHLRLVGSIEQRTRRVQEVYHLEPHAALEFLKREDKGRRRYLQDHYHKDIEDPLLYDLVLNTDRITYADAARWVGEMVIRRLHLERPEVAMMV
jgi:cytidylate kinase